MPLCNERVPQGGGYPHYHKRPYSLSIRSHVTLFTILRANAIECQPPLAAYMEVTTRVLMPICYFLAAFLPAFLAAFLAAFLLTFLAAFPFFFADFFAADFFGAFFLGFVFGFDLARKLGWSGSTSPGSGVGLVGALTPAGISVRHMSTIDAT